MAFQLLTSDKAKAIGDATKALVDKVSVMHITLVLC